MKTLRKTGKLGVIKIRTPPPRDLQDVVFARARLTAASYLRSSKQYYVSMRDNSEETLSMSSR
jgi:hypothetical protein